MTVRFFINSSKIELANIYVRLTFSRKERYICKTKLLVETSRWSNQTETIRQRIHSDKDKRLIKDLSELKEFIKDEACLKGIKDKKWLEEILRKFHSAKSGSESLNGYISKFINRIESGELKTNSGANYTIGTVKAIKGFQGAFNRYQGVYTPKEVKKYAEDKKPLRKKKTIDFEGINTKFYHDFVKYLTDEGYKLNTIGRFVKELKMIMHQAFIEKKHQSREYEEFTVFSESGHAVYLSLDEIDRIYNYKCSGREELARDCFIVLCETALRISDYKQIDVNIKEIKGRKFIDLFQKKTSVRVIIPLTHLMNEILKKYKGRLPYIHEVYVNKYIKTVCFNCGIKDMISWPAQKKGLKYTARAEKWTLISCHTGRRSAVSNMRHVGGMTYEDIMKITGHKDPRTVRGYDRETQEEAAIKIAQLPYFNLRVS
jgi:integrase